MTNENYKASASSLIDAPEPLLPERPRTVNIALGLIMGGLLIQLLVVLKSLQEANFHVNNPQWMALIAVEFAFFGLLCHQLARGRRWARLVLLIVMLVLFANVCLVIGVVRRNPEMWELLGAQFLINRVLPLIMNFVALHLLFFSSGDWFGKNKT